MKYAVATPSRGTVHSRTIEAVMANIADVPGFVGWVLTHDLPIPECDEVVSELALATGAHAIWYVEEDVIPPPGALQASIVTMRAGWDVVAVDYPVGSVEEGWGCLVREGGRGEILWCGLGSTLIRRELFEALPRPWFSTEYRYIGRGGAWEQTPAVDDPAKRYGQQDIHFCMSLRAAGFRIGQVPGMTAKHAKVIRHGQEGTNVGYHTIQIRDTIKKQYPG